MEKALTFFGEKDGVLRAHIAERANDKFRVASLLNCAINGILPTQVLVCFEL